MDTKDPLEDLGQIVQAAQSIGIVGEESIRVFLYVRLMEIASERWGWEFKNDRNLGSASTTGAMKVERNGHQPEKKPGPTRLVEGNERFPVGEAPKKARRAPVNKDAVTMGSQPHKILVALQTLATHAAPLSAADLRDFLEGVPKDSVSSILSKLYDRKMIHRVAVDDKDSEGKQRTVFKYYMDEGDVIPEVPKANKK